MIVQNHFIKKLKDFGLNSYEAKIWTALLSRGVSSAGELSDIANVPRSRAYDILESLEKKGFILIEKFCNKDDKLVKNQHGDGNVKSSSSRRREFCGMRRTYDRRSEQEMKRNAEIGLFTKPSRINI